MPANLLTSDIKMFIVQSLACFDSPSVVAVRAGKELGVKLTRQQCEGYDPTKQAGAKLSRKWRSVFEETRKAFLKNTATIAISHRAVRLRALQRMAEKAEDAGNMALSAQCLKQAAEEMGGAYTNRREFTGKDGKELPPPGAVTIFQLPDNGRG